jgi:hypothetical protein
MPTYSLRMKYPAVSNPFWGTNSITKEEGSSIRKEIARKHHRFADYYNFIYFAGKKRILHHSKEYHFTSGSLNFQVLTCHYSSRWPGYSCLATKPHLYFFRGNTLFITHDKIQGAIIGRFYALDFTRLPTCQTRNRHYLKTPDPDFSMAMS